jgi:gliding motility-associated-like protein
VTLTVNSLANHTYQWRKDGVDLPSEESTSLSASQEGVYTVTVTNIALNCETETSGVSLTVMQPPVAAYSAAAAGCTDEELTFTNESQVDSRATVVYGWNFGDGFNSSAENPTHAYTTAQTFNPSLTVNYQGVAGCSDNETKSVAVVGGTQPAITPSATSTCPDEEVTLTLAGTFTSVLWSNEATEHSIAVLPGTYTVTTVDANGCEGNGEVVIAAKESPELVATADPATISAGSTAQLNASGAATYSWLPAETLDDPTSATPLASPVETTTYMVTGTSADGCGVTLEVMVTVAGVASFPPAFSPNGDGQNDIWNVQAESRLDCILSIFDGRGRRIFENSGENWDGTWQGKAVPEGTYYYVYGCPDQKPVTGSVLIFR